jgi:hypothetical protein
MMTASRNSLLQRTRHSGAGRRELSFQASAVPVKRHDTAPRSAARQAKDNTVSYGA